MHTNAAYSRLTGIDSHTVVGKPITTLLSIPDNLLAAEGESINSNEAPDVAALEPARGADPFARDLTEQLHAAEAAGRARASRQNRRSVGLERLVAASGFGRLHVIQVHAKPHHMVGKNVTVIQNAQARARSGLISQAREEGSNDASHASSGRFDSGHLRTVKCRSSIAPVVSSPSVMDSIVVTDKEQSAHPKAKRRKVHEQEQHRKHGVSKETVGPPRHHRNIITHYVIQLQPQESAPAAKQGSEASLSSNSTSVEARLLGLTKSELQKQRLAVGAALHVQEPEGPPDDAAGSESSDTVEPVTAIG